MTALDSSEPDLRPLPSAAQGWAFLAYRDQEGRSRTVSLDRPSLTVGRDSGLDLCLAWDAEVSRVHAEFQALGGQWTVLDDGLSRNGTWINGERVHGRRRLHDGDGIRIGSTLLGFHAPTQEAAPYLRTVTAVSGAQVVGVSPSQRRVLIALCRPYKGAPRYATPPTNQQIADELFLSVDAVKTHLRALFAKFDLDSLGQNQKRSRLVELVLNLGVISEQEL